MDVGIAEDRASAANQSVTLLSHKSKWAALRGLSFILTIYSVIFNGKSSVSRDFCQTSCASNWMQKAGMFLRLRFFFSQTSDLTSLMNTYQTRRQIPDYSCLNQPAGHIPPGTAHVSRGFLHEQLSPPLPSFEWQAMASVFLAAWSSAVKLDFTGTETSARTSTAC